MDAAQVRALATELEATFGLLTGLLAELRAHQTEGTPSDRVMDLVNQLAERRNLAELPAILLRVQSGMADILGGIRLTREAIEAHAVERIQESRNRLTDVSATTESATIELMDGLDRSLELINSLETQTGTAAQADAFRRLRGQVSALYSHLQFQDITSQQLRGVTHSLLELETRVAAVGLLFDHALGGQAAPLPSQVPARSAAQLAFNADATLRTNSDQATVDAAFKGAQNGAFGQSGRTDRA